MVARQNIAAMVAVAAPPVRPARAAIARSQALQAEVAQAGEEAARLWMVSVREIAAESDELARLPGAPPAVRERARSLAMHLARELAALEKGGFA